MKPWQAVYPGSGPRMLRRIIPLYERPFGGLSAVKGAYQEYMQTIFASMFTFIIFVCVFRYKAYMRPVQGLHKLP